MRSERGMTLVELLVGMAAGTIVILTIFAVIDGSLRGSARVTQRVEADQRARPVLTRIMDELHSTCVAQGVAPILAGSSATSLAFHHQTGSAVSPNPDKRVITFSNGVLTEKAYHANETSGPPWTFSSTPFETRELLTDVTQVSTGTPLFEYGVYSNSEIAPVTPPATGFDTATADKVVQVTVSFSVSPQSDVVGDENAATTVSDTALLRFAPAGESVTEENLPCG